MQPSQSAAGPAKPGRARPPSTHSTRRERKRAADREAQKAIRERNKRYITYLETTVERLTRVPSDERVSALATQLDRQREEIERLKDLLRNVGRLAQGIGDPADHDDAADWKSNAERYPNGAGREAPLVPESMDHGFMDVDIVDLQRTFPFPVRGNENVAVSHCTFSAAKKGADLQGPLIVGSGSRNYFEALSNALDRMHNSDNLEYFSWPEDDDDIAIRVVLHGWDAAKRRCTLDRAWELLEEIDAGMFQQNSQIERVAILRMMRSVLIYKICPINQPERTIPQFMIPSELQRTVDHAALIDYFAWPPLRDQLILSQIKYGSEVSAALFASNFRFLWPFRHEDAYAHHKPTGRYHFCARFTECADDLESWKLLLDLRIILPAFNIVPGSTQPQIPLAQCSPETNDDSDPRGSVASTPWI